MGSGEFALKRGLARDHAAHGCNKYGNLEHWQLYVTFICEFTACKVSSSCNIQLPLVKYELLFRNALFILTISLRDGPTFITIS